MIDSKKAFVLTGCLKPITMLLYSVSYFNFVRYHSVLTISSSIDSKQKMICIKF